MKKSNERGTVTLEACIVVPVFIILMLLICGLFIMFMGRQVITHAVIQAAKSMSFDPYYTERMDSNPQKELNELFGDLLSINENYVSVRKWYSDDSAKLSSVASNRVKAYLKEKGNYSQVNSMLDTFGVVGGAGGLKFTDSKVEDGALTLKVSYKQKFPLDATGLAAFDRSITVKVRLFTWSKLGNSIYEVSFNSKGGSNVSNKVTEESNGSLPIPSRPGYMFLGWSTDPKATVVDVPDLDTAKKIGQDSDGKETLYAVWLDTRETMHTEREPDPEVTPNKPYSKDIIQTGWNRDVLKQNGLDTIIVDITFDGKRMDKDPENDPVIEIYSGGKLVASKTYSSMFGYTDWNSPVTRTTKWEDDIRATLTFPSDQLSSSGDIQIVWKVKKSGGGNSDGYVLGTTTVIVDAVD